MKATISVDGACIVLDLPGTGPQGKGHQLRLPETTRGLAQALRVIREHSLAAEPKIGTKAAPTQYVLDKEGLKLLRKAKPKFTDEQRTKARDVLRKLGMI